MATLLKNYPQGLKDEEIKKLVQEYSDELFEKKGNINTVLQLMPFLIAGSTELHNRFIKKIMLTSIIISVLALLVAITAIILNII